MRHCTEFPLEYGIVTTGNEVMLKTIYRIGRQGKIHERIEYLSQDTYAEFINNLYQDIDDHPKKWKAWANRYGAGFTIRRRISFKTRLMMIGRG